MWILHQHEECPLPNTGPHECTVGDIWKCDSCGKLWRVTGFLNNNATWLPMRIEAVLT